MAIGGTKRECCATKIYHRIRARVDSDDLVCPIARYGILAYIIPEAHKCEKYILGQTNPSFEEKRFVGAHIAIGA